MFHLNNKPSHYHCSFTSDASIIFFLHLLKCFISQLELVLLVCKKSRKHLNALIVTYCKESQQQSTHILKRMYSIANWWIFNFIINNKRLLNWSLVASIRRGTKQVLLIKSISPNHVNDGQFSLLYFCVFTGILLITNCWVQSLNVNNQIHS